MEAETERKPNVFSSVYVKIIRSYYSLTMARFCLGRDDGGVLLTIL